MPCGSVILDAGMVPAGEMGTYPVKVGIENPTLGVMGTEPAGEMG